MPHRPGSAQRASFAESASSSVTDGDQLRPIDTVLVIQDYKSNKINVLSLYTGETVFVLSKQESGWWDGVLVTSNGLLRGWFPSNFTKSIYDDNQQRNSVPVNQPQSLASVLRQNLNDDSSNNSLHNKSRKNSTVSFASSDHELSEKAQATDRINFLTSEEVEASFNSLGSGNAPIWIPQLTKGNKIVYYNAELNVYCKELPYIETPHIDDNTTFHIPIIAGVSDGSGNVLENGSGGVTINSAATPGGLQLSSTNLRNFSSLNYERKDPQRSRSSLPSTSTVHPWNSSLYCLPGLFYYDPTDIKTWPALRDAFIHFLVLTLDALQKKNSTLFLTYFNISSRLGVLINLSARLAQNDLRKSGYQSRVQKRLRKIASAIAKVGVNGDLYLNSTVSNCSICSATNSFSNLNNSTSTRNFSTSTQETLKPQFKSEMFNADENVISNETESEIDSSASLSPPPRSSESPQPQSREETETEIKSYFVKVSQEIDVLKKCAISITKIFIQISSNQFNEQNYLPQVYPRFLNGFFSGGSWTNPFLINAKDPFENKDISKPSGSIATNRKHPKNLLKPETLNSLVLKKDQLKEILQDVLDILELNNDKSHNINLNNKINDKRNVEILSKIHKSLSYSSKFIDLMESLDFSVFLTPNRRDSITELDPKTIVYPIITELFETKQAIHDVFGAIIMDSQNLTIQDSTVFRSIKEDSVPSRNNKFENIEPEKSAKALEIELNKLDVDYDEGLAVNLENNLKKSIDRSFKLLNVCCALVQQLVTEREALINYASRIMNDDYMYDLINIEREDSTLNLDEFNLPSGAENTKYNDAQKSKESNDMPWFLDSEEFNLIFSSNDLIKGGTKEALIQRLTHHQLLDSSFNVVFLLTFKSIYKTTELIQLLIKRFNIEPPENLAYEEYQEWVSKKAYPIKLRVVNIMKTLLQKYWTPNYNEPHLYAIWNDFAKELVDAKFPGSDQLLKEIQNKVYYPIELINDIESNSNKSVNYPAKIKKMKLTDIDAVEFAKQLTLREFQLYLKITKIELLDKSWNNKYTSLGGYKNVQNFISNSNDLTNFVSKSIVMTNDLKKRVGVIKYFIAVAEKCRQLNNYSSMTAIISALYSSPIHRLKLTWKAVPEKSIALMTKMNDLMNSSRNFSEYREHMNIIHDKPCVPFLGVYLSDLTFITNGNPDHLHGDDTIINFAKRIKTADILRDLARFQSLHYNIKKNEDIQEYIDYSLKDTLTLDEQYNRSLILEPRNLLSEVKQKPSKSSKVFQHFVNAYAEGSAFPT